MYQAYPHNHGVLRKDHQNKHQPLRDSDTDMQRSLIAAPAAATPII